MDLTEKLEEVKAEFLKHNYQFSEVLCGGRERWMCTAHSLRDQKAVAIKVQIVARGSTSHDHDMENEGKLLEKLNHKNIVAFYERFQDENELPYIVMELATGGSLWHYQRRQRDFIVPRDQRQIICRGVAEALEYLSRLCILHGNVKRETILLFENFLAKLADFGCSREYTPGHHLREECGTSGFMPPEMASTAHYRPELDDVYSLGVVLKEMANGKRPLGRGKRVRGRERQDIRTNNVEVADVEMSLIARMTEPIVTKRITIGEVLAHPYMS